MLLVTLVSIPVSAAAPRCDGRPATVVGTTRADVLRATPGDDVIAGLGGDDVIYGYGGDDVICGGPGRDTIYAGIGDDILRGGADNDHLFPGAGRDAVFGGADIDKIDYQDAGRGVTVNLRNGKATGQGQDSISTMEMVAGSRFDDTIRLGDKGTVRRLRLNYADGRRGDDVIIAGQLETVIRPGPGDDKVFGSPGTDEVQPSSGDDEIHGGAGNDMLDGGAGGDVIYGGPGRDQLSAGVHQAGVRDELFGGRGYDSCSPATVRRSCETYKGFTQTASLR